MDQKIDINSGDWKKKNECIYYSQEKRVWYCAKCDEIIKSPRTANTHAGYHTLTLPCSRRKPEIKKIEVKLTPVEQPQQQTQISKTETHYGTYSENRNYSYNPSTNREYNDITSPNYVPTTPLDEKIWKRLQGKVLVEKMRMTGLFSDEDIEEKEIEFGLKPKEDLAKKAEVDKKPILDMLMTQYIIEEDPDRRMDILLTLSMVENETNPQNVPYILAMMPKKPQQKRDTFSEKIYEKFLEYVERTEKEPSILDSTEKLVDIIQMLRKKPNRNHRPTETVIPLTPSDNGLDQNIKP